MSFMFLDWKSMYMIVLILLTEYNIGGTERVFSRITFAHTRLEGNNIAQPSHFSSYNAVEDL